MNHALKAALAGVLATVLTTPVKAAPTIMVEFDLQNSFPSYTAFDGSFVASDLNGDGVISQDEVSAFRNNALGAAPLLAFGDFDIATDTWTTDHSAIAGDYYALGTPLNTYYDAVRPETTIGVPEPANALLLGCGIAALALARRHPRSNQAVAIASKPF